MENSLMNEKELIKNKVYCSNVYVNTSTFSTKENEFDGAFAKIDFKAGDIVEWGYCETHLKKQEEEGLNTDPSDAGSEEEEEEREVRVISVKLTKREEP